MHGNPYHCIITGQMECSTIQSAKDDVRKGVPVKGGRLKNIATELRIDNDILTKAGKLIVPAPLRDFVLTECHGRHHEGSDKVYEIIKSHFYWPNMYNYIKSEVDKCDECAQRKSKSCHVLTRTPSYTPTCSMEMISIDIALMPKDKNNNRYILLITDLYSKYVEIVPVTSKSLMLPRIQPPGP